MSVSKGGIDLDGTSVALESSLDILHLLEGVAHVAVQERKPKSSVILSSSYFI